MKNFQILEYTIPEDKDDVITRQDVIFEFLLVILEKTCKIL